MRENRTSAGMKVLAAGLLVFAVGLVVSGCGPGDGGGEEGTGVTGVVAGGIEDGAEPMNSSQGSCPVCGASIRPSVHTEGTEERVYFDKEQCLQKWNENPDKYMEDLKQQGKTRSIEERMERAKKRREEEGESSP